METSTPKPHLAREGLVAISVDDGHPSDLRAAGLLASLGYAATFYVPARNAERAVIDAMGVRRLSEMGEVGAHTYNHVTLPALSDDAAMAEIRDGKVWLEDILSLPITSFCYPRGKFNRRIRDLVVEAGFNGARTAITNHIGCPCDAFLSGVTSQAYSHRRHIHIRHALLERNWSGAMNYARIFRFETDWMDHFDRAVAYVSKNGGVAHLWFHSWELDTTDQWSRLEVLLRRLKGQYQFRCVTNGELFSSYAERPSGF